MDRLIAEASRALAQGDALGVLKRVALREDAEALALRGVAMAQLGDLTRARELLRAAARGFGAGQPLAGARCDLAAAEIALVTRDLAGLAEQLARTGEILSRHGDRRNAAHAGCLQARLELLVGRLDAAGQTLARLDPAEVPPLSRPGYWLVAAGIAMRRVRAGTARLALDQAAKAAGATAVPALIAEVAAAEHALSFPAVRMIAEGRSQPATLSQVEALFASDRLIVDACRNLVRQGGSELRLSGRPVLFGLLRLMAEAAPRDVAREALLLGVFRARDSDESHRARLRVEIGRLRKAIRPFASVQATGAGYVLKSRTAPPVVLAPPVAGADARLLAVLADGEAWSSSALALALDVGPRNVQRALETLGKAGKVVPFGQGRARRWIISGVPGFPTSLLLPALPQEEGFQ